MKREETLSDLAQRESDGYQEPKTLEQTLQDHIVLSMHHDGSRPNLLDRVPGKWCVEQRPHDAVQLGDVLLCPVRWDFLIGREAEGFPSDPGLVLPGNLLRRRDAFLESPRSRHVDKRFGMRREDGDGVGREESEAEEVI